MSESEEEHAISYKVVRRGHPVEDADGTPVGTIRRVREITREHMLDGIDVDTPDGVRFVDAPEVGRITTRAVTLTITAAEVAELDAPESAMGQRVKMSTTVRRARRFGDSLKDRWERR
ncbi:MAG: hypothetical protein JHC95_12790 [Solirubrobacteraceae bacterium]|nr:hypothetical protein [Solirubrobacteraceae bacterium]